MERSRSDNLVTSMPSPIDEDGDDYEALPSQVGVKAHMMAGAAAGIMEHCIMYPVDVAKTRMQSLSPNRNAYYRSVTDAIVQMSRHEGLGRPFRGMSVMVVGAGPAHAMYFACYEKMKRVISRTENGTRKPLAQAAAGGLATVLHDAVMNPADVIKQRMQMFNSPYKGVIDCAREIWRREGMRAFYRSYTTQLAMNVPYQSIHFITYEFFLDWSNPSRGYSPIAHMSSGAIAGAFASAITTPLDVCKTLLNTQETDALALSKQSQISGLYNAGSTIYNCCGWRGFFQGLQARVIYSAPSTAIAWSVYEFFKYLIAKRSGAGGLHAVAPSLPPPRSSATLSDSKWEKNSSDITAAVAHHVKINQT